jgi:anaerobic magnesium-protoporphyrin IX monomethyl ester cyclase
MSNKIKILFIYPNGTLQNPPPISIAVFYALLKNKNTEIKLFDATLYDINKDTYDKNQEDHLQVRPHCFIDKTRNHIKQTDRCEDLQNLVDEFGPDLIAMSCNEVSYPMGLTLLESIKNYNGLTLVGGVFPTFAPEKVIRNNCVDMICVGEGEEVLVELIDKLANGENITDIKNLWIKTETNIIKNDLRPLVDLNEIPLPDYDIFEEQRYYRPMAGRIWKLFPIETSRGCQFSCTFCNSPSQRTLYQGIGRYFRKKSVKRIDEELSSLVSKYKAEYIFFITDTLLCLSNREFDEFCKMYSKYSLPFYCQNRPEMITCERMKRLKEIGCVRMTIGVQQGNEAFRKDILKINLTNEKIIEAFEILEKVGIVVSVDNIIGFPCETRELVFDTIRLNRQLQFDTSNAFTFAPFHGTELHRICLEKGYIRDDTPLNNFSQESVLDMPEFPKQEIAKLVKTFALYARLPEKYFGKIKIAEKDDEQGKKAFRELCQIYKRLFF